MLIILHVITILNIFYIARLGFNLLNFEIFIDIDVHDESTAKTKVL